PEPLLAFRRRSVRPRVAVDAALGLALDTVVSDRPGRVERVGDVLIGDRREIAGVDGVRRPDARVAIGLQLRAHGVALGPLASAGLAEEPEEVLDVMTVLVRQ